MITLVPPRAWECNVCRSVSSWTDDHQWYGSLLDIDGGAPYKKPKPIIVTCSDLCRDRAVVLGMVPADAKLLS